jgi:hypothetical protein
MRKGAKADQDQRRNRQGEGFIIASAYTCSVLDGVKASRDCLVKMLVVGQALGSQFLKTGVSTSLRLPFAVSGHFECYRDFSPTALASE